MFVFYLHKYPQKSNVKNCWLVGWIKLCNDDFDRRREEKKMVSVCFIKSTKLSLCLVVVITRKDKKSRIIFRESCNPSGFVRGRHPNIILNA